MSAIQRPSQRVWLKQPLDLVEGLLILIAFAWCLVMFVMMPYWKIYGKHNLSNEAYRTTPESFAGHVPTLLAAGASFIGGCCGTSPLFIEAAKRHLQGTVDSFKP